MDKKLIEFIVKYVRVQTTEHNIYKIRHSEFDGLVLGEEMNGETVDGIYHCYKCGKYESIDFDKMKVHIKEHNKNGDFK